MDILSKIFSVDFILFNTSVDRWSGYVQQVSRVLNIAACADKSRYEFLPVIALLAPLRKSRGKNKVFEAYRARATMNGTIQG